MVENVLITLGIAAVLYVMVWAIRNDRARSIAEQQGLLRMREPEQEEEAATPRSRGARAAPSAARRRRS